MVPPLPAPIQRRGNRLNQSAVAQAAMVIPETVFPEGWDAPLQNPLPRLVPFLPAPALRRHIDLDPEHRPLNAAIAQRIFQGWEQQHEADLEEDFNDLGPQNDIPSEDDLEYVDPAEHQLAEQLDPPLDDPLSPQDDMSSDNGLEYVDPAQQRPAEDLDPALPNDPPQPENPAENIPAKEPGFPLNFLFHHSLALFSLFQKEGNLI
ncbi:hypothetical protein E4T56_gene16567 [Termitomyces sp. T112]|nr:hypothetical protein E4T56_gene16567 [Termitomyces sp. T112]